MATYKEKACRNMFWYIVIVVISPRTVSGTQPETLQTISLGHESTLQTLNFSAVLHFLLFVACNNLSPLMSCVRALVAEVHEILREEGGM